MQREEGSSYSHKRPLCLEVSGCQCFNKEDIIQTRRDVEKKRKLIIVKEMVLSWWKYNTSYVGCTIKLLKQ
jgi:hypothetical protein